MQSELKDASRQTNELIDKALDDLKKLGAEIVDPGEKRFVARPVRPKIRADAWATSCSRTNFRKRSRSKDGKPVGDHIKTLVAMSLDPAQVPEKFSFLELPRGEAVGEGQVLDRSVSRRARRCEHQDEFGSRSRKQTSISIRTIPIARRSVRKTMTTRNTT